MGRLSTAISTTNANIQAANTALRTDPELVQLVQSLRSQGSFGLVRNNQKVVDALKAKGYVVPDGYGVGSDAQGNGVLHRGDTWGDAVPLLAAIGLGFGVGAGISAGGTALGGATGAAAGGEGGSAASSAAGAPAAAAGGMSTTEKILLGLAIAGSGLKIAGQIEAGNAAKDLADFNASVAEAQASDAITRGQEDAQRFRMGVRQLIGSQKAGFAGQNVDVGQGSPAQVQGDAAYLGELDALKITNNAAREAWGYKVQAQNARLGGQNAQNAGYFGAASTALGTGASLLAARYGWA